MRAPNHFKSSRTQQSWLALIRTAPYRTSNGTALKLVRRKQGSWEFGVDTVVRENDCMMIAVSISVSSSEVLADLEEVCRQSAAGIVRDQELLRRVYARSAKAREETLRRLGIQAVGVQIIHERE